MPVASIHLFSLNKPEDSKQLLKYIKNQDVTPLVLSQPIRWIVRPESITTDDLLKPRWDLLMILEDNPASQKLISSLLSRQPSSPATFKIIQHFTLKTGIPSRLTKSFITTTNPSLLHPTNTPSLTGALNNPLTRPSSQTLALSPALQSWIGNDPSSLPVTGAVSMLNFLSFKPDQRETYLKYGRSFAENIGAKRGGNAKLVGNIIHEASSGARIGKDGEDQGRWHEFALAHYPSLLHFADMLGSEDYQEVNQRYRVPSLADTCILCTSELEIERMLEELKQEEGKEGEESVSAKL